MAGVVGRWQWQVIGVVAGPICIGTLFLGFPLGWVYDSTYDFKIEKTMPPVGGIVFSIIHK
jgi:hypothetical protein